MRSDPISCETVAGLLPAVIDGNQRADRRVRRHVDSCLRCQAELVQYRKLLRALRQLRTEVLEPSPNLLSGILAGLEEAGERGAMRSLMDGRKTAYLGGLAVATAAAGAAGAVVLVSRSRQRRPRLAG
jgi:anti-sigma factor RsiW